MFGAPWQFLMPTNAYKETAHVGEVFQELVCHFLICQRIVANAGHDSTITRVPWVEYLFFNVSKKGKVDSIRPVIETEVGTRIFNEGQVLHTIESDECGFHAGDKFESFHHQAKEPISELALLVGFLSIWLKGCVVPSRPKDRISIKVLFLAVLLAIGYNLVLLPAIVSCIHHGLRELATEYLNQEDNNLRDRVPNPKVELPYTYLVIWYTSHCSSLMSTTTPSGDGVSLLLRYEHSKWTVKYHVGIRQILHNKDHYHLYYYFPEIDGTNPGDEFEYGAGSEGFTCLSSGCFN